MQVFKAFCKIAGRRLNTALIYFAIYAVITLTLSFTAGDSVTGQFTASALSVSILDEDQSTASEALSRYLASLHHVSYTEPDDKTVLDKMYYRTLDYALTIPAGFEDALLSGDTQELLSSMKIPGGIRGHYVDQQISQYLQNITLCIAGGYSVNEAVERTDAALANLPAVETVSFLSEENGMNSGIFYFFQYMPYIFITILFSGMAPILVTLNGSDLKNRTACSSLSAGARNWGLTLGCCLYSFGTWLSFLLLCFVFYRADMFHTNGLLGTLNSFTFLLFSAATTLFVSCFAPDYNTLNMLANIVGLSMAFLCGIFVPQSMLPASVLSAAKFLPAYWYIRANNMLGGFGSEVYDMNFYWLCIGIQLLFTAAMFSLTIVASRQRRLRR